MSATPYLDAVLATRQGTFLPVAFVDLAGDVTSGLLLAQIAYWHGLDRRGQSRLTVERGGHLWLAKAREDWWEECRLTPKQVRRCLSVLEEKGLVATALWKFGGAPTTHVRLIPEAMNEALCELAGDGGFTSPTSGVPESAMKAVVASPDATRLANLLADLIEANGSRRPKVTGDWLTAIDRMIRIDERTPEQVERCIRWCQADDFWKANVLSPAKLRQRYDQLRLAAQRQMRPTSATGRRDPLSGLYEELEGRGVEVGT